MDSETLDAVAVEEEWTAIATMTAMIFSEEVLIAVEDEDAATPPLPLQLLSIMTGGVGSAVGVMTDSWAWYPYNIYLYLSRAFHFFVLITIVQNPAAGHKGRGHQVNKYKLRGNALLTVYVIRITKQ
ncbi:hypothetical protein BC829DRAFT_436485 [Chytridium lagenaria]|nr:hypothetical protein BC829DRAFT_436485 [Chytridium lagenaria]